MYIESFGSFQGCHLEAATSLRAKPFVWEAASQQGDNVTEGQVWEAGEVGVYHMHFHMYFLPAFSNGSRC